MSTSPIDVLVVGTGQAAAQAAISLRQMGFSGSIQLIGEENNFPYERPPLSKSFLAGDISSADLMLRPSDFWPSREIAIRLGTRITAIDPVRHIATADNHIHFGYRHLVWAAGGAPRKLDVPGITGSGVHTIRNQIDVCLLRKDLADAISVVIIGGGYIGLEAAAVLVKAGKRVTVIEREPRLLARIAAEPISKFFENEHRDQGVNFRLSTDVVEVERSAGRIEGVRLTSGECLAADVIIVGIGLIPNHLVLANAGADVGDGVLVDEALRTTLPDIFAIGDCALHRNAFAGDRMIRIESVQNAIEQGKLVASVIAGVPPSKKQAPWFWSDQYDLKFQSVGLKHDYSTIEVNGDPNSKSFSVAYFRDGRLIAMDCVNAPREFANVRRVLGADIQNILPQGQDSEPEHDGPSP